MEDEDHQKVLRCGACAIKLDDAGDRRDRNNGEAACMESLRTDDVPAALR